MNKKVLVTGGAGFVGRQTLPFLLERGYEVHWAGRGELAPEYKKQLIFHSCDLLDPQARTTLMRSLKPTHLLHLAWHTVHGKFWTAPENHAWAQAGAELVRDFAENGGTRVVAAGTCAEYDWSAGRLLEDQTPLKPATLYGVCKNSFRETLQGDCSRTGLSWAWGRVFFLYGPFETPNRLVSSVILSLLKGERARCSDGTQLRDLLHVADVASGFVSLLESEFQGPANISSGVEISLRQVVTRIAEKMGAPSLLDLGALPRTPNDPPLIVGDCARLKSLGWAPRFTLDTGLDDAIAWWRTALRDR